MHPDRFRASPSSSGTVVPGRLLSLGDGDYIGYSDAGASVDASIDVAPVDTRDLPDELSASSLIELQGSIEACNRPEELLRVVPLYPGAEKVLETREFDRELGLRMAHVQHVAHHPHERLLRVDEVSPIGRARRVPPRAIERLVGRTEDWQSRTARRIIPSRVLTQRNESVVDIYENRVTRVLIDNSLYSLAQSESRVRRVEALFEGIRRLQDTLGNRHWQLADRSWKRFADALDIGAGLRVAAERLEEIARTRRLLRGLMSSRVYQHTDARTRLPLSIEITNLLAHDQHYRHVAALWSAWLRSGRVEDRPPEDAAAFYRLVFSAMERFVVLLLAHAIHRLGLELTGIPRRGGPPVRIEGRNRDMTLRWTEDGCLELTLRPETPPVVVIPLGSSPVSDAARSELLKRDGRQSGATFITYLTPPHATAAETADPDGVHWTLAHWTLGNDLPPALRPAVGLVPVSPLDVDSEERMTRLVRWVVALADLEDYPGTIRVDQPVYAQLIEAAPHLFARGARPQELKMIGFAKPGEIDLVMANVREAAARVEPGRRRDVLRVIDRVGPELDEVQRRYTPLQVCPTCSSRDNAVARPGPTFVMRCNSCGTSWGLDRCGDCGSAVPTLTPEIEHPAERIDPSWIDLTYGGDVEALPCWATTRSSHHICTTCGSCPASQAEKAACARCQTLAAIG